MNIYRRLGLSLSVVVLIISFIATNFVSPLIFIVLMATSSLTYYAFWTRGLAQKFVYLLAPIFIAPFAVFIYKTNNNPKVYTSQILAMAGAIAMNMLIWGEKAFAPKRKSDSI